MAVFADCLYAYYMTLGSDKIPSAATSTYAQFQTDHLTGKKVPTLEARYFQNANKKGQQVIEFKVNGYSGVDHLAIYSKGFQLVINADGSNELYYYDTFADGSFETGHIPNSNTPYFVEIDGGSYVFRLDGKYSVTESYVDGWKIFRTVGCLGLNFFFEDTNFNAEKTTEYTYTYEDLMMKLASIIRSSSYGTGDSIIPLIDLGDFLHVYEVKDGQISGSPLGKNTYINSYYALSVHYERNGLCYAGQSMFNSVAYDSNYNVTGVDFDVNYWKAKSVYNLTERSFEKRYSSIDNGFLYSLSSSLINELKNYSDLDIYITFDLSKFTNVNVIGFDYYALNGIVVKELFITSNRPCSFKLLVGSLKDTELTSIKVHNVSINNFSNVEVAYEMV